MSLISPWLDNGNVVDYLAQRAPESNCVLLVSSMIISWHREYNNYFVQSLDVAEGLEYLHLRGMIHGDMKGVSAAI